MFSKIFLKRRRRRKEVWYLETESWVSVYTGDTEHLHRKEQTASEREWKH